MEETPDFSVSLSKDQQHQNGWMIYEFLILHEGDNVVLY